VIEALLGSVNWATIGAVVTAVFAVIFGMFQKQKAKTATAEAELKVSQKDAEVANASVAAHKAGTEAVTHALEASKEAAAVKDEDLDQVGASMGILREGK